MSNFIPSTKAMEESHAGTDSMIWGDMENMVKNKCPEDQISRVRRVGFNGEKSQFTFVAQLGPY